MTDENQIQEYTEAKVTESPKGDNSLLGSMLNNHELINNMDIDKFKALIELHDSQQKKAASIEFNKDFAAMQEELPVIPKTKKGHNSKYAPYEEVKRLIQPVMGLYGFRDTYSLEQKEKYIKVTARISHKSGHCEETTVELPHENSGNKNEVHAVGSSISYGKRYALIAALGLSTCDDDDGNASSQFITREQAIDIEKRLEDTQSNKTEFLKMLGAESIANILASQLKEVETKLKAKERIVNKEKANAGN